jgi:hypothetical protein
MSHFDEIANNARYVSISRTETFLKQLFSKQSFRIKSTYPTIDTIFLELEKGDRCFTFKADQILPIGPPVKFQNKGYGFEDSFDLITENKSFSVPAGVRSFSISLGDEEFPIKGQITELKSNRIENISIFRAILPLSGFDKRPVELIKSQAFKSDTWIRAFGFIELQINGKHINLFDARVNGSESLIIECTEHIDLQSFENIMSGLVYSFGLISGSLIRNEIFFLQYENNRFEDVLGFYFKKIEDSLTGLAAIDPRLFAHVTETKKIDAFYITPSIFQRMIEKSVNDRRFIRAVKMITESSRFPLEIKASTYSVALETMKNIIIEDNTTKINPFKNKHKANEIIKILKKILEPISDEEFNNKRSVINKLDQLNQIGNKEGFLLSFKLLSIALSKDDERCLIERNNFLHGKIPFENELPVKNFEIQHIVYKLHMLLCSLILKYSGYSGFILNNIKLVDLTYFKKNINEQLLREI